MRRMSLIGLALSAGFVGASQSVAQAQPATFDGQWSVEVITEKGGCDKAYRYPVVIEKGQARYGGREDFNVSGRVASNGAVNGIIARGENQAQVTGRLSGSTGAGTWTASGNMSSCSGRWNAEKRG